MAVIKCFNRRCHYWDDDEPDNCGKESLKGPIVECDAGIVRHDPRDKGQSFYIRELHSTQCACEKPKRTKYSFCYSCYRALPSRLKQELYYHVGGGYEEAYEESYKYLEQNVW